MNYLVLLLAEAIFVAVSWRRLVWGLALIIVLLPSYLWRWEFFGLPTTFLEIMIWSLFLVWLFKDKRYNRINWQATGAGENPVPDKWRWLLIAWLAVSMLALAVHPSIKSLGLWRAYWLEPMMFFLVFMYAVRKPTDIKIIIRALGVLVVWLFFIATWQKYGYWSLPAAYTSPNTIRLTSIFSYPNALSLLTAPLASLFAGLYLVTRKNNIYYLVLAAMGVMMSVWAVSQGALAGIITALVVWCLVILWTLSYRRFGRRSFVVGLIIAVLVLGFAWQSRAGQSFRQQLFRPVLDLKATSLEIRSNQWQETWQMLMHNFVFGAGIGDYQAAVQPYHKINWLETYMYPHDIFLNFWTELGLLGLLLLLVWLFFIAKELSYLHKADYSLAWPLSLAWLTWFIQGLVDVPYFKNDLSVLFFVLLALTLQAKQRAAAIQPEQ